MNVFPQLGDSAGQPVFSEGHDDGSRRAIPARRRSSSSIAIVVLLGLVAVGLGIALVVLLSGGSRAS
jgi:hypothetical protein